MCEMGRRLYQRGFAAANEGNLSFRLDEDRVLCTPTLMCKGFMEPEDLCTVDMAGEQLAGRRKRTSEILLHVEIYRRRPELKAIVHCHPPHATAFAIAREPIPLCVLPEAEVFLGEVPIAPYATPGSQSFAETIAPFIERSRVIVLANHGTVSFDADLERAYWWTEILDAYCRILLLARQLGSFHYLDTHSVRELLELKQRWNIDDPRLADRRSDCELCTFPTFRSSWSQAGVSQRAFPAHGDHAPHSDAELVERIARRVAELMREQQP
jgi:L-fuculose-phosphate aldolase